MTTARGKCHRRCRDVTDSGAGTVGHRSPKGPMASAAAVALTDVARYPCGTVQQRRSICRRAAATTSPGCTPQTISLPHSTVSVVRWCRELSPPARPECSTLPPSTAIALAKCTLGDRPTGSTLDGGRHHRVRTAMHLLLTAVWPAWFEEQSTPHLATRWRSDDAVDVRSDPAPHPPIGAVSLVARTARPTTTSCRTKPSPPRSRSSVDRATVS